MSFNEWLTAKGFDLATLTESQRTALQAAWRAEQNPDPPNPNPPTPNPNPNPNPPAPAPSGFEATVRGIEAEAERIRYIEDRTQRAMEENVRSPDTVRRLRELCESAVADRGTDQRAFDLALLRLAGRFNGPMVISGGTAAPPSEAVAEAALARRAGLRDVEKHYDARTLELSDRHFRRGLGLQDLLGMAARANGWRGASVRADLETRDFWAAAFGGQATGAAYDIRAGTTGPSTYSVPTIIGNVANKFLTTAFMAVDSAWSRISARRSVNDFKQTTSLSLTGDLQFKKLAPGGEIRHGTVGELAHTNQADTYGIMLGIDRRDLINDDLGALSAAGSRLGRGAGLKINDVFWTVFLNNSSFFAAGNNNVSTGAGSALGTAEGAAINAAEVVFMNQTDPDGKPLAVMPRIMLVPPTLANTARRWMGSSGFTISGTAGGGDTNIYQGRYQIETSPYMENSSYTGYSTAAWYLLADPADMPVIEGVFLNGRDTPTVESSEADFNQLGMAWRGWLDFGFALQHFRGGVRSAGS